MNKTNKGLVEYAKAQLGKPYWYGTFGNTADESLLKMKRNQYPAHYQQARMNKYRSELGERVHDCVGLIKGYLWSENSEAKPIYNSSQDVSANGMLLKCKERGRIYSLPEIAGTLVFMPGHVGVYIGGGKVIEARGFNYGVVETKLSARPWETWGKCPWVKYPARSRYFEKCQKNEASIVDALKSIGENSSYSARKAIADANGIENYAGTANQNIKLLSLLKQGILIKPERAYAV